jgi:flavodoxin
MLIVYDSMFGNTAAVAKAMGAALEAAGEEVRVLLVGDAKPEDVDGTDLVIMGSPTRGFRPTPAIQEFIGSLGNEKCTGLAAAAFDTRLDLETIHPTPLRWVIEVGGYASSRLQSELAEMGCTSAAESAGFMVLGTEGPLKEGELERAGEWARTVAASVAKWRA